MTEKMGCMKTLMKTVPCWALIQSNVPIHPLQKLQRSGVPENRNSLVSSCCYLFALTIIMSGAKLFCVNSFDTILEFWLCICVCMGRNTKLCLCVHKGRRLWLRFSFQYGCFVFKCRGTHLCVCVWHHVHICVYVCDTYVQLLKVF